MLRWLIAQIKSSIWVHKPDLNGFQLLIAKILVKATVPLTFQSCLGQEWPIWVNNHISSGDNWFSSVHLFLHRASEVTFPHDITKSFLSNFYILSSPSFFISLCCFFLIQSSSRTSANFGMKFFWIIVQHSFSLGQTELAVRSFKLKMHHVCKWSHFKALNSYMHAIMLSLLLQQSTRQ